MNLNYSEQELRYVIPHVYKDYKANVFVTSTLPSLKRQDYKRPTKDCRPSKEAYLGSTLVSGKAGNVSTDRQVQRLVLASVCSRLCVAICIGRKRPETKDKSFIATWKLSLFMGANF